MRLPVRFSTASGIYTYTTTEPENRNYAMFPGSLNFQRATGTDWAWQGTFNLLATPAATYSQLAYGGTGTGTASWTIFVFNPDNSVRLHIPAVGDLISAGVVAVGQHTVTFSWAADGTRRAFVGSTLIATNSGNENVNSTTALTLGRGADLTNQFPCLESEVTIVRQRIWKSDGTPAQLELVTPKLDWRSQVFS